MLPLLVREVSGSITFILSTRKEVQPVFSLNICITFWKTTQLDSNQLFCLFFKDNSIILSQFENFSIPLPPIGYISYQEMKIIENLCDKPNEQNQTCLNYAMASKGALMRNNKKMQNLTKNECKIKMKSQVDRKFDSTSQLLYTICVTACFSVKKRSKQE